MDEERDSWIGRGMGDDWLVIGWIDEHVGR